jgi:hypothetical protein
LTTEALYSYVAEDRACNRAKEAAGTFGLTGFTDVSAGSVKGL